MNPLVGEWSRRLLDAIAREAYKHSSEAEVARRAHLHPRFLSQARRRGRIQLDQALALIAALGYDPGAFIARTLGGAELPVPLAAPAPTAAPLPDFLRRAYDRAQSRWPSTIPRSHLEMLAEQRESHPRAVLESVEASLDFIAPEDVPFALGIWATIQRLALDFESAERAIEVGLELAEGDSHEQVALKLKRAALLACAHNDSVGAEQLLIEAADQCQQDRTSALLATSLVDRMTFVRLAGEADRALDLGLQALEAIHPDDVRGRFSALNAISLCHLQRDDPRRAVEFLDQAEPLRPQVAPFLKIYHRWLQALSLRPLDGDRAERTMLDVTHDLAPIDPRQAALAAIDLGLVILHQGDSRRAHQVMRQIVPGCFTRADDEVSLVRDGLFHQLPERLEIEHLDTLYERIPEVLRRLQVQREASATDRAPNDGAGALGSPSMAEDDE